VLDMFFTRIRLPPLYKREDHDRLRNPTSNHKKTHLLPLLLSLYAYYSSRLSMRFGDVLSDLADPRTTSLYPSLMGLLIVFTNLPSEETSFELA